MEGQFFGATSPMHPFNLNSSSVCTNHIVLFINIFLGKKNTGPTIQRQRQWLLQKIRYMSNEIFFKGRMIINIMHEYYKYEIIT